MNQELEFMYDKLDEKFDGRQMLGPVDLEKVMDYKLRTIYNKFADGSFPIPVVNKKRRPRCRLIDVAKYLVGD